MDAKVCVMVLLICVTIVNARLRSPSDDKRILMDANADMKGPAGPPVQQRQTRDITAETTGLDRRAGPQKITGISSQLGDPLVRTQRSVKGDTEPSGNPGDYGQLPGSSNQKGQKGEVSGMKGGGPAENPGQKGEV